MYFESVFVALVMQHVMDIRPIILLILAYLDLTFFFSVDIINNTESKIYSLNFVKFCPNKLYSTKNYINVHRLFCKVL